MEQPFLIPRKASIWFKLQLGFKNKNYSKFENSKKDHIKIVDWISVPLGVATLLERFSDVDDENARFYIMSCYFEQKIENFFQDFDTVKSVFDSYVTPPDEIEDLNRRGAYMHVLADALVSVLILIALILGMLFPKLTILDPLIGVIGGVIIARWALSLITESKNRLLGLN